MRSIILYNNRLLLFVSPWSVEEDTCVMIDSLRGILLTESWAVVGVAEFQVTFNSGYIRSPTMKIAADILCVCAYCAVRKPNTLPFYSY